jgi:hypothetical protein
VRVVRVHDVKSLCSQEPSQEQSADGARKVRRNRVDAESFGLGAALERPAGQGDDLGLMAAGTKTAQQKQNLVLASAPVGARVEMQ